MKGDTKLVNNTICISKNRKKEKIMILGFIKANFPGERRVPLLP